MDNEHRDLPVFKVCSILLLGMDITDLHASISLETLDCLETCQRYKMMPIRKEWRGRGHVRTMHQSSLKNT